MSPTPHHLRASLFSIVAFFAILLAASAASGAVATALLADDPTVASATVAELRAAGQAGVDALMAMAPSVPAAQRPRFQRAFDTVCGQYDCAASGLYWHTDLERARAEAQRSGRPILSLRLLGRLDEDRSCANSRFFRTVLYPDPAIARTLRDSFVLHWSSERPVPALHIDFGDGRTLEGTITGNSVHYVLDAKGRLVDALPGLYGPGLFLNRLTAAALQARRTADASDQDFVLARQHFHRLQALQLELELTSYRLAAEPADAQGDDSQQPYPTALQGAARAGMKSVIEEPVLRALSPVAEIRETQWRKIAEQMPEGWQLSEASRRFLLRKHAAADPQLGARTLAAFEASLALDTVRNEYQLHAEIHRWLAEAETLEPGFESFNARVYAELFLTPAEDPWLGLVSPDTYLALDVGQALD